MKALGGMRLCVWEGGVCVCVGAYVCASHSQAFGGAADARTAFVGNMKPLGGTRACVCVGVCVCVGGTCDPLRVFIDFL